MMPRDAQRAARVDRILWVCRRYGAPGCRWIAKHERALGFASYPSTGDCRCSSARQRASSGVLSECTLRCRISAARADVLLFYTQEFAFIEIPDAFTTGLLRSCREAQPECLRTAARRSAVCTWLRLRSGRLYASSPPDISAICNCSKGTAVSRIDQAFTEPGYAAAAARALVSGPSGIPPGPDAACGEEAYALS